MSTSRKCPFCAESISASAEVCPYCGRDPRKPLSEAQPQSQPTNREPRRPRRKGGGSPLAAVVAVLLVLGAALLISRVGVYSVQPIGALPEGVTVVVWRVPGEPFFNSPDATCLRVQGYVSLLCRGVALSSGPVDRIIVRLPFMRPAYLLSTGGREFDE